MLLKREVSDIKHINNKKSSLTLPLGGKQVTVKDKLPF